MRTILGGEKEEKRLRDVLLAKKDAEDRDLFKGPALGQIHQKSLERAADKSEVQNKEEGKSFKEVLINGSNTTISIASSLNQSMNHQTRGYKTVFFTGFADNTPTIDLWIIFKNSVRIKDIILHRIKDKLNKRYGFAFAENVEKASKLIRNLNGSKLGRYTLVMDFAKSEKFGLKTQSKGSLSSKPTPAVRVQAVPPKLSTKKKEIKMEEPLPEPHPTVTSVTSIAFLANASFTEELKSSVILTTIKLETTESVTMIVEGLGFKDVAIRGISGKRFLAYFRNQIDFKEVDLDFLKIGFAEVKMVELGDLIPTRKTWIECRGLPMQAWTEDNFIKLLSKWGDILHYAAILDDEGFYQNPRFHVETSSIHRIDTTETITIGDSEWEIKVLEFDVKDIIPSDPKRSWFEHKDISFSKATNHPLRSGSWSANSGVTQHVGNSDSVSLPDEKTLGSKCIIQKINLYKQLSDLA